jgi:hypothetical protein
VVSKTLDCAGQCRAGACDGRCPVPGQGVTYVSVDGAGGAQMRNDVDGRRYACALVFDNPRDAFDCKTGPRAGTHGRISGLGLRGSYCTGGEFGNIAVIIDGVSTAGSNENCSYACKIVP